MHVGITKNKVRKLVNKTKVIHQAVESVQKRRGRKLSIANLDDGESKLDEIAKVTKTNGKFIRQFANEIMDMTEQEFCQIVSDKLKLMVNDSLSILHDKLDEIPPQHLAYACDTILKNSLTLAGRPSSITASASVKLGDSEMTPDQVRETLKGTIKKVRNNKPKKAEIIEDNDNESEK